jgi:hypothetical protein
MLMPKRLLILFLLLVSLCAYGQTSADRYPVFLLRYRSLQKELRLSTATAAKIDKIQKAANAWYIGQISPTAAHPESTHQADPTAVRAHALKVEQEIVALLNGSQRTRLREVGIQYAGAFSLGDKTISKSLGITPDQLNKLRAAGNDAIKSFNKQLSVISKNDHVTPGKGHDPKLAMGAIRSARLKMRTQLKASVKKILSAKQYSQWQKMQGRPFPVETLYS